jgi:hypothetical protein
MADPDPGSLDRLHDIVAPAPVPWWPPAPGWYVVGGLVLVLLGAGLWAALVRWERNGYRRAGLKELERITRDPRAPGAVVEIAELLKRVALAAFPRARVASLTGETWLRFLDATAATDVFTRGAGRVLGDAAYRSTVALDPGEFSQLADAVGYWIGHHRC